MKNSNVLQEFKKQASDSKPEEVRQQIQTGSTYWYRGCAVDAPDKVIALKMATGITVQFDEEDVLDIQKEKDIYHVQVKDGSNFLASYQMAGKVNSNSESHGCDDSKDKDESNSAENSTAMLRFSTLDDFGMDNIFRPPGLGFEFCYREPYLKEECFFFRDKCGNLKRECFFILSSRRVCRWV